jgi:hypothetical protein
MLSVISAEQRANEPRRPKILLLGSSGIGKTWQLRTLDRLLSSTLFIDIEAGDQSVIDVQVNTIRPTTWPECKDIACRAAGPDPASAPGADYSQAHFEAAGGPLNYETYFLDSITRASQLCYRWAEGRPESISDRTGKRDTRGTFGLTGREMIGLLHQFQRARQSTIIMVGILERNTDDFGFVEQRLQCAGTRTARELPGIIDQIVTLQFISFSDGKPPVRAFVCGSPNEWGYPAKDRSGRLDRLEEPNLGKLITKLNGGLMP